MLEVLLYELGSLVIFYVGISDGAVFFLLDVDRGGKVEEFLYDGVVPCSFHCCDAPCKGFHVGEVLVKVAW